VSNAYDLNVFVDTISKETSAVLCASLRPLCVRQLDRGEFDPADEKMLMRTTCARQFNEALLPPGTNVRDHLAESSCAPHLSGVTIPLLCLSAEDDHMVTKECHDIVVVAQRSNPNIVIVRTKCGGHLGWLTGWTGKRWWVGQVFDFFEA
jgi:predicted alpha/beta-fold hydrolase